MSKIDSEFSVVFEMFLPTSCVCCRKWRLKLTRIFNIACTSKIIDDCFALDIFWYISIYYNISIYSIYLNISNKMIYHDISILYLMKIFWYIVIYHLWKYIDIFWKFFIILCKYFTIYHKCDISRYIISWYIAIYCDISPDILIYRDISSKYRQLFRYLLNIYN